MHAKNKGGTLMACKHENKKGQDNVSKAFAISTLIVILFD
ncbi:unnamed protein product [Brassica oleracea var. botrytis]